MIDVAARENLWVEVLDLLGHLSEQRLAREVARLDPSQRALIEQHARDAGMTQQLALIEQALTGSH